MRIVVDAARCQGHARCWSYAPDLISLNDEGYIEPGDVAVPEGQEKIAKHAVLSCPERALKLED
jgi:ferredoxin